VNDGPERSLVASHLLDEALRVLTLDVDLERIAERDVPSAERWISRRL